MAPADYVIVGAGSAGCVLAARLTEDPSVRVMLIEAGGKGRHPNITIPAAFANQFHTKLDWDYDTEPEPHCDGRSLYIPRGKGLGGSSSMNAMLYVRGRPLDYDLLGGARARRAGAGRTCGPYFLKRRAQRARRVRAPRRRRPANVADERSPRPFDRALPRRRRGAPGSRAIADYNGPEQDGAALCPGHAAERPALEHGRRLPAPGAGSRRTSRSVTSAPSLGVELEGGRAAGVRCRDRRGRERSRAPSARCLLARGRDRLAAAAACSPASGRPITCARSACDVAPTCPASAQNLQDHPYVVCVWESRRASRSTAPTSRSRCLSGLCGRSGPLTSSVAEAAGQRGGRPERAFANGTEWAEPESGLSGSACPRR